METVSLTCCPVPERDEILRQLGYFDPSSVTDHVRAVIDQCLGQIAQWILPWAGYRCVRVRRLDPRTLILDDALRLMGPRMDWPSTCRVAVFSLVSLGGRLEERIERLVSEERLTDAVALDAIGGICVDMLQARLGEELCHRFEAEGLHVGRPVNCGLAGWSADGWAQFMKASHAGLAASGIEIDERGCLRPRMALAGFRAVAADAWEPAFNVLRDPCPSCARESCVYRLRPRDSSLSRSTLGLTTTMRASPRPSGLARPIRQSPAAEPCERPPAPGPDGLESCALSLDYAIPVSALARWSQTSLSLEPMADGGRHYRFRFAGSTCVGGGLPIHATLHALLRAHARGIVMENGWIEIGAEDAGLRETCGYHADREQLIESLLRPPDFCGKTLEEILTAPMPVNPAGCFCTRAMLNHKWRQMLSTIHYTLRRAEG